MRKNALDDHSFHLAGVQSSLFQWSSNICPVTLLPSSTSPTVTKQCISEALREAAPDTAVPFVHKCTLFTARCLTLGAVASSLSLSRGVLHAVFLVFNVVTTVFLLPAIDRHSFCSLYLWGWRPSVNSEPGQVYPFGAMIPSGGPQRLPVQLDATVFARPSPNFLILSKLVM